LIQHKINAQVEEHQIISRTTSQPQKELEKE